MSASESKPLIAISCRNVRETPGYLPVSGVRVPYLESIIAAGGVPLLVPVVDDEPTARRLFSLADGVMFPGGEDVEPRRYGEDPHPKLGAVDPDRDDLELKLARWAVDSGKPILGICRGIQLLNIAMGGSLFQDIGAQVPTAPDHGMSSWEELKHDLEISPGSRLAGILGVERIMVNSLHHQAIKQVGKGLRVVGRTPDGLIEAVEGEGEKFVVGVQCHPETLWQKAEPRWRRLFDTFVEAAERERAVGR